MDQKIPTMAALISPLDDKWWEEKMPAKYFGTASYCNIGPQLGSPSIYVTENAYLIQISLPGVGDELKLTMTNDQTIKIWSTTNIRPPIDGCFERMTNNLYESGEFSISIQLPGPVDLREFKMNHNHGILQMMVGKK